MKKFLSLLLCCLMVLACSLPMTAYAADPLKIVTTIFPPYDFVREIAGDVPVELKMLLAPGAESHSFEPSPQDIIAIQNSDIFIHAGGEGDAWIERILDSMDTSSMTILTMTDMVQTVSEEIVEGMEHDHGHEEEAEPFDPAKVYNRELTEWTGSWKSLAPYVADGSLDEYIQLKADENEVSFEERLETQKKSWRTDDFNTFMVAGDKFYIDTGNATYGGTYTNEGFHIIQRDDGSASVWYQYQLADGAEGMPQYIVFNDHGFGTPPEGADEEEGHSHDHGVAHTHLKYGNTSFEEVIGIEGWSTFYVDSAATNEQILDTLMGHDSHDHSHEETFTLADIKDRALTDWEGDWQSVYPYLVDGTLDPVMEHKAESGEKTAAEYKEEYDAHYVTDVDRVVIDADSMTFYRNNTPVTAQYIYRGTGVLDGSSGYWVRYKFEAVNPPAGAPKYIMFSDHLHAPQKTAHFHIYASDVSFDELMADGNPINYPTYYDSGMSGEQIVQELVAHDSGSHSHEMDEHVWTSPANAMEIVRAISGTMGTLDSDNAQTYAANADAYITKLQALDAEIRGVVEGASGKTLLFGDRFPFRYFADAYGLDYFAAFTGCSTSTDASAATIAFLIDKAKEENLPVVFKIELSNGLIANTIAESTGAKVLELHSAHNLTKADFDAGVTYLDVMERNVEMLKEALQ